LIWGHYRTWIPSCIRKKTLCISA